MLKPILTLLTTLLLAALVPVHTAGSAAAIAGGVKQAHAELWQRFVDPYGIIHDYVGELPTPEDCSVGRPNGRPSIPRRRPLSFHTSRDA